MADTYGSGSSGGGMTDQAKDQVQQVAGQATEKLQEASGQVTDRVKQEVDTRSSQAGAAVGSTAHSLRAVAKELRNQGEETPAKLADQVAEKVEQVSGYLTNSDPNKMLSDVENFGRRQPWLVVGAGMAIGFVAARFLKASSGRRYDTMYGWRLPASQASGVTGQVPSSIGTDAGPVTTTGSAPSPTSTSPSAPSSSPSAPSSPSSTSPSAGTPSPSTAGLSSTPGQYTGGGTAGTTDRGSV
jgi:ElaB/YqjD/DUF883 family membrane-anchored ribosome-binding protein